MKYTAKLTAIPLSHCCSSNVIFNNTLYPTWVQEKFSSDERVFVHDPEGVNGRVVVSPEKSGTSRCVLPLDNLTNVEAAVVQPAFETGEFVLVGHEELIAVVIECHGSTASVAYGFRDKVIKAKLSEIKKIQCSPSVPEQMVSDTWV